MLQAELAVQARHSLELLTRAAAVVVVTQQAAHLADQVQAQVAAQMLTALQQLQIQVVAEVELEGLHQRIQHATAALAALELLL